MYDLDFFFFSSRRRHTRSLRDWSSDVCSSDLSLQDQLLRREMREKTIQLEANAQTMSAILEVSNSLIGQFDVDRSEEHTSELQSRRDLVCRLLLEKKKYANYVFFRFCSKRSTC